MTCLVNHLIEFLFDNNNKNSIITLLKSMYNFDIFFKHHYKNLRYIQSGKEYKSNSIIDFNLPSLIRHYQCIKTLNSFRKKVYLFSTKEFPNCGEVYRVSIVITDGNRILGQINDKQFYNPFGIVKKDYQSSYNTLSRSLKLYSYKNYKQDQINQILRNIYHACYDNRSKNLIYISYVKPHNLTKIGNKMLNNIKLFPIKNLMNKNIEIEDELNIMITRMFKNRTTLMFDKIIENSGSLILKMVEDHYDKRKLD